MWLALVAAVLVLAAADELMRQSLKFRAWRSGCPTAAFYMSKPFGIPNFIRMIGAVLNNRALEHTQEKYHKVNRKTFIQQFSFDMEYHTADPENIKAVLATQFKDFDLGLREKTLGFFVGSGIFTVSGEKWKHSRAMLRPQFSRELVAQLSSVDAHVAIIVEKLQSGARMDFQALFHKLTMDTATEFLFGESTNSLTDSSICRNGISARDFVADYKLCLEYSLVRFSLGPLYWLYQPLAFRQAIARSRRYVDYFVQKALDETSSPDQRYTFSYELAKVTRDPVEIRDQLFNILIAGHDTTANLLGYFFWYMGHYPHIWAKLRESILAEFDTPDTQVTFEGMKRLTFLTCTINEVLRLHPIVPRNLRFATRDTTLPRGGGPDESQPVFVPKGCAVAYSPWQVQRDPDFWGPAADEFNPMRWSGLAVSSWTYLPFNGGPRICLGQQFALTEASLTIIRMAQNFASFELDDPCLKHPKTKAELTGQVAGGVWGFARPA